MTDQATIERDVVAALRTCYDPEIPVNIWELGLIYDHAYWVSGIKPVDPKVAGTTFRVPPISV